MLVTKALEKSMYSTKEMVGAYPIICDNLIKHNYRRAVTKNFRGRRPRATYLDSIREAIDFKDKYEEVHGLL